MTSAFQPPADPLVVEGAVDEQPLGSSRRDLWIEIGIAVAIFIAFCVIVLAKATSMMEPDDYAYRGAIASLAQGHLELTTAQYKALSAQLGGIQQWTQLPNGRWMSEKNPGYPFYAVWFWWAHALRFAPLFAGGLASVSLFVAARKWLGKWAGAISVAFFLGSGLALAFAYRATMPTFTDAAFLAAGAGAILWALLSPEVTWRRRTSIGLLGFVAMEWAVFMRYTDLVVLGVAIVAVFCAWRPARLKGSTLWWWLGSVGVFGAMVLIFDWAVYGSPTKTGYANGEITFSIHSIIPNLKHMPELLFRSVPAMVVAAAAVIWMAVRLVRSRLSSSMKNDAKDRARRDGLIGGFLALGWLGLWGLYSAYTWTVQIGGGPNGGTRPNGGFPPGGFGTTTTLPSAATKAAATLHQAVLTATSNAPGGFPGGGIGGGGGSIHLVRFYVPAIGLIALLATWFVMQLPRWLAPVLPAIALVAAVGSFHTLTAEGGMGGFPGGRGNQSVPSGGANTPGRGIPPANGSGPDGLRNGTMPDGLPPGDGRGSFGPPGLRNGTMPDGRPPGQ